MITSIINYIIEGIASAAAAVCGAIFDNMGSGLAEIQSMLPGLESLDGILTLAGAVTVAAGLYLRLASASASSISERTSEHPVRIGARALAAGASVAAARPLCTYVTGISERVFTLLLNSGGASAPASAAKPSEVIVAVFTDLIPVAGAGSILLHLLLSVIMAWNLIKISLLAFEQYLLLTVSVHLSPLLAGFCVSPATQDIASGFAKAFMGQCLTLTASAWGFRVFTLSLSSIRTLSLTGGISLLQMAVLVLFGGIIASIDTVMAKLGLSSVPSPSVIRNGVQSLTSRVESTAAMTMSHALAGTAEKAVKPLLSGAGSLLEHTPSARAAGSSFASEHPVLQSALSFASGMGTGGARDKAAEKEKSAAAAAASEQLSSSSAPVTLTAESANTAFGLGKKTGWELTGDKEKPVFEPVVAENGRNYLTSYKTYEKDGSQTHHQAIAARDIDSARMTAQRLSDGDGHTYTVTGSARPLPGTDISLFGLEKKETKEIKDGPEKG